MAAEVAAWEAVAVTVVDGTRAALVTGIKIRWGALVR
jgi:hypothetical protein